MCVCRLFFIDSSLCRNTVLFHIGCWEVLSKCGHKGISVLCLLSGLGYIPRSGMVGEGVKKRKPLRTAVRVGTDPGLRESVWKTAFL